MTVGNTASMQFKMAQVQTKYGSGLDSLYGAQLAKRYGSASTKAATKSLEDLLKSNSLKNKSDIFREQFSNLYKNIYGITDDGDQSEGVSSLQSIKTASAAAGGAAESIKSFADGLKYGGEVDVDAYKTQAQNFVDSYNTMIDKVGDSDKQNILQKGVLMTNTGKVYSSSLKRAGIVVGADNKLSLNTDLSGVKATDIKTVFGSRGFSDKVIQKASQINTASGGNGSFIKNISNAKDPDYSAANTTSNAKTMKDLAMAVKELSTEMKSYASGFGNEDGKKFMVTDFTDIANDFVEKYNNCLDESAKSDNSSVRQKGSIMRTTANAYKHALGRSGIAVGDDGKLSITDAIKNVTEKDVKYSFGYGGFTDKVAQKADQIKALVSSASAMGYNSDKAATYAYNTGALYSVYA